MDAKKAYKSLLAEGTFLAIFEKYDSERIEDYDFFMYDINGDGKKELIIPNIHMVQQAETRLFTIMMEK